MVMARTTNESRHPRTHEHRGDTMKTEPLTDATLDDIEDLAEAPP